jgi:hypothetical protein
MSRSRGSPFQEEFGTVLFTDVVGSAALWTSYIEEMKDALATHERDVLDLCTQHTAMLIKGIGDAYMILFSGKNTLYKGIQFAKRLQSKLRKTPIHIGPEVLRLRIGMAFGPLYLKPVHVQNQNLLDVFGPTVNVASRMESKVCPVGGWAFTDVTKDAYTVDTRYASWGTPIQYSDHCSASTPKRSFRLISTHPNCKSITDLKGVQALMAYAHHPEDSIQRQRRS